MARFFSRLPNASPQLRQRAELGSTPSRSSTSVDHHLKSFFSWFNYCCIYHQHLFADIESELITSLLQTEVLKCVKWPQVKNLWNNKNAIWRKCDLGKLRPFRSIYSVLSRFVSQGVINVEMFVTEKALTVFDISLLLSIFYSDETQKKYKERNWRIIWIFVFL